MSHFYLSVAGVMGSGKTTVSRLLAARLGYNFLEENVSANVFLPRYYKNPKEWALRSQIFYLREKAAQLLTVKQLLSSSHVVQDTPIYQDCFTYAKAQHLLNYMSDDDHELYLRLFELLQSQLPAPNLIIQLDAAVPALEERIKRRGRDYEKTMTRAYLQMLADLQNEWIIKNPHLPVLRVKTDNDKFDILSDSSYQNALLQKIMAAAADGET